jgi:hypothetical protein
VDPSALARAVREALADPEASRERALTGVGRVEGEFGADRWLARHEELYRAVVRGD